MYPTPNENDDILEAAESELQGGGNYETDNMDRSAFTANNDKKSDEAEEESNQQPWQPFQDMNDEEQTFTDDTTNHIAPMNRDDYEQNIKNVCRGQS